MGSFCPVWFPAAEAMCVTGRNGVTGGDVRRLGAVTGLLVKRISAQWWMPGHEPTMKDVASCEKLRGAASKHRSGDV